MMTALPDIPKQVREAIYDLIKYSEVELVAVFGSRARNDNQKRADIDIAIRFKSENSKLWCDIQEYIQSSALLPMDIVNYDKMDKEMQSLIIRDGKLIFLNKKWFISLSKLGDAVKVLSSMVKITDDEIHMPRNSTIQCFEFVTELYWKTFKHLLEREGKNTNFPRESFVYAYQAGWIDDEQTWQNMIDDRNQTSHTYKEAIAEDIYRKIKQIYFPVIEKSYVKLYEKFMSEINLKNLLDKQ